MSDEAKPHTMNVVQFLATVRELEAAQKRIAELEATLELKRNTCTTHAGARMACGQCHDSLRSHFAEAERRVKELEAEIEKWKDSVSIIMREAEVEHRRRSDERDTWKAKAEAAEASAAMLREALVHAQLNVRALTGGDERRIAAALTSTSDAWLREHDRVLLARAWDAAWDGLVDEPGWTGHKEGLRARFVKEVVGG